MISELHCHTSEYSACSHVNAVELIQKAFSVGLQAIVITDHHYQWNDEDLKKIKEKAGVPETFAVLSGQEFKSSDYGDVLVYGVKDTIKKQSLTVKELREKFPDAAIVWAHPYRHNKIPEKEKLLNPDFDAIEIFSSNYTVSEAMRALKDYHELKFTAIAGTDTHALSYTGTYPTIFDHPFTTIEELVVEIKAGRCRPYFKEVPKFGTTNTTVTELTIGPKTSDSQQKIIIKKFIDDESWKEGERTHHLIEEICKHGFDKGKYRVSQPLDKDEKNLALMEKHVAGKELYDLILDSDKDDAKKYLKMAAGWLAEFHNRNFHITPPDEYLKIERPRLEYYLRPLVENNHAHAERVKQILEEIWKDEVALIENNPGILVQGHGDFHLKNILIGYDKKTEEEYAAAIDFNSSYQLPKAFDVGSFIAQYENMFFDNPEVQKKAPVKIFYDEYMKLTNEDDPQFNNQIELYKARTNLSIMYYLVKVGKGTSENFWTILVNSERSLAHFSFRK